MFCRSGIRGSAPVAGGDGRVGFQEHPRMSWNGKTKATVGSVVLWAAAPRNAAGGPCGRCRGELSGAVRRGGRERRPDAVCGLRRRPPVAWVDLPGGSVTRRVAVPAEPTGLVLTPDGTQLIVTCAAPQEHGRGAGCGRRASCSPRSRPGIRPWARRVSPGRQAAVRLQSLRQRCVGDRSGAGEELARVAAVREPVAAAVTPDGRTVLVANHLPHTRTDAAFDGRVSPS